MSGVRVNCSNEEMAGVLERTVATYQIPTAKDKSYPTDTGYVGQLACPVSITYTYACMLVYTVGASIRFF